MSGNTADVVAALPSLDIAMIEGPPGEALPPGTAVHAWREDEIVAIVPTGHPLAAPEYAAGVTLDALAAHPLVLREAGSAVRQLVERAFAQGAAPMRVAFEIAGVEAVKEAVRAGMGVGFVSAMSLRHDDAALVLRSLAPAAHSSLFHSRAARRCAVAGRRPIPRNEPRARQRLSERTRPGNVRCAPSGARSRRAPS